MSTAFLVVLGVGYLISLVGSIMVLVAAFRESVLWGLGCIFVPFVSLIFIIKFWDESKRGFFVSLAGLAVVVVGFGGILVTGEFPAAAGETDLAPTAEAPSEAPSTQLASSVTARPAVWNEPEPAPKSEPVAWQEEVPVTAEEMPAAEANAPLRLLGRADAAETSTPPTSDSTPAAPAATEQPQNAIEKVWADRDTHLYYTDACKDRPARTMRIAKSAAVLQGFKPAPCE